MTSLGHIRSVPLGSYSYPVDYSIDAEGIIVRRFRPASRRPLARPATPGLSPKS